MSKVNQFDATRIMLEISKVVPIALIAFAAFSFIAFGVFCVDYYESLFVGRFGRSARYMAILIAVIQEAVRFGLLVASVRDFSDNKRFNGWLGLGGSIGMVLHDLSVAHSIASMWSADNPLPYTSLFSFLILIGLLLEFRLILTVDLKGKKKQAVQPSAVSNGVSIAAKN